MFLACFPFYTILSERSIISFPIMGLLEMNRGSPPLPSPFSLIPQIFRQSAAIWGGNREKFGRDLRRGTRTAVVLVGGIPPGPDYATFISFSSDRKIYFHYSTGAWIEIGKIVYTRWYKLVQRESLGSGSSLKKAALNSAKPLQFWLFSCNNLIAGRRPALYAAPNFLYTVLRHL